MLGPYTVSFFVLTWVFMGTGLVLCLTLSLFTLILACMRDWAYVGFLSLLECTWASLALAYGQLAGEYFELSMLFWACAWLMFSAVELVVSAFLFIVLLQTTGQSTLSTALKWTRIITINQVKGSGALYARCWHLPFLWFSRHMQVHVTGPSLNSPY